MTSVASEPSEKSFTAMSALVHPAFGGTMKSVSVTRWFVLVGFLCASAALANWTEQGEGSSSFKATGPAGFKIVGATKSVAVSDDGKTFTATVKLAEIDTDNSLRNKHMLEDLEAAKYPTCALSVPSEAIKEGVSDAQATGTFSMHGKTKAVPFKYTTKCTAGVCDVEGSADLNLKDFDIKIRSYLGITVKPEVSVSTRFQIKK
jgi:polyisoprenoid-binding protein YceI